MHLKVKKAFKWAHRHVDVQEHNAGDVIDTEDKDLIRVSIEEGWTKEVKNPADPVKQSLVEPDASPQTPLNV